MPRHDVHRQRNGELLLDVQADILHDLNTRIVVPLMEPGVAPTPGRKLNPQLVVDSTTLVMVTQYLAAIPAADLGPVVANLDARHDEILAALDMLFLGF